MEDITNPTIVSLLVTKSDYEALKRIRDYFGEHDKTHLEHLAYDVLDRLLKPKQPLPCK